MGETWRTNSGGNIRLVIYPDGTQGGEADMVRLMRVGTLQAGLLTVVGLSDIEPAVTGLQNLPMMFRNLEEVEYINKTLTPRLEQMFAEKGFVVLFWADAGWLRFFSKEQMTSPDDLKRMKMFVWAGNPRQMDLLKSGGFQPVGLETGEILTGLQTGLVNVLSAPPIFVLAGQLDLKAPHMLQLNWAPLVGAAVVKKEIWDTIPKDIQLNLLAAAEKSGAEIQAKSRLENSNAVDAMVKRGLKVNTVTPELEEAWRRTAETFYPGIRGAFVPKDIFDEVERLLKDYRAQRGRTEQ
jgi:TRAP-type C4-dicarboxylate transport system substrate-binding protein